MIHIVEIAGPNDGRAIKEYEAASIREALKLANHDLRNYPQCEIVNVIPKYDPDYPVDKDAW